MALYALTRMGVLAPLLSQGRPAVEGLGVTFAVAVRARPPLIAVLLFLRAERAELASPEPGPGLERRASQTPAASLVDRGGEPAAPSLDRIERVNLAVALLVALAVRVLVVGAVVGLAFFVFGRLVIDEELTGEWVGATPNVLLTRCRWARRARRDFLDDVLERFRRVMAAWSYYRGAPPAQPGRGAAA